MKIEKAVADPVIISNGVLSKSIESKEIKINSLIIHESLLNWFYSESQNEKSVGMIGIDELAKIKMLMKSNLKFSGKVFRHENFSDLSLESIRLAYDEAAVFITTSKESLKTAKALGVETIVFDRGPFKYHGILAELANAARTGGLKF